MHWIIHGGGSGCAAPSPTAPAVHSSRAGSFLGEGVRVEAAAAAGHEDRDGWGDEGHGTKAQIIHDFRGGLNFGSASAAGKAFGRTGEQGRILQFGGVGPAGSRQQAGPGQH